MEIKIKDHSSVKISKNVVSCELDGEVVVLNHDAGIYFGLEKVGSFIWNILQKPSKVKKITALVLQEYHVEPKLCRADIEKFLREAASAGIICVNTP